MGEVTEVVGFSSAIIVKDIMVIVTFTIISNMGNYGRSGSANTEHRHV